MVTTKGAGLNPNAKVWQEISVHQNDIPEGIDNSAGLQTYPSSVEMTEGYSDGLSSGSKESDTEYLDITTNYGYAPTEGIVNGTEQTDLGHLVFDSQCESPIDGDASKEQPMSEETLRESLKKQLEFCFSRENLSKDLYLISQMDSDQFVPIWTIACMEDIKVLTTDMDLILDVLRASPMVQVNETGEKVRPNHSRCIIILREVPETTPVEEVEALFKSDTCPKVLSAEFAHNSNWYITFQSDMDALQAYRYLREEVKTFQGKPIMARIKAINTFFGKNGFQSVDSSVYQQAQPQASYGSHVYMQQVYNPQQQYPVYPVVPSSWNSSPMPYFETPLAPFPNSGFMNGYISAGNYKANSSPCNSHRPRSRHHVKGHPRPVDASLSASLPPGALMDGLLGPLSPPTPQTSGTLTGTTSEPVSLMSLKLKDTSPQATIHNGDPVMAGRARRGGHRGMRRKREEEHNTRPVPLMEMKVPSPPKFDLAASNFPPLPGCVVNIQGETTPEMRLSDVVRGLKLTDKSVTQEENEIKHTSSSLDPVNLPEPLTSEEKPSSVTPQAVEPPVSNVAPVKKVDKEEPHVLKAEMSLSVQAISPTAAEDAPPTCNQAVSTVGPPPPPPSPTSEQGQRKLSYAEVCQRLAKEPPPVQTPSPSSPDSVASQPLQELKVNRVKERRSSLKRTTDKPDEPGDSRPPHQPLRSFRGTNGSGRVGGAGLKTREQQRDLNTSEQFSQEEQGGLARNRTFPQSHQNNSRKRNL